MCGYVFYFIFCFICFFFSLSALNNKKVCFVIYQVYSSCYLTRDRNVRRHNSQADFIFAILELGIKGKFKSVWVYIFTFNRGRYYVVSSISPYLIPFSLKRGGPKKNRKREVDLESEYVGPVLGHFFLFCHRRCTKSALSALWSITSNEAIHAYTL